ncbi:MAG: DNA polymerase Y family protein [Candidatus Hydrogenedentes bacterium]|nr:DNA polymerase Y family protein [Candidatus Hydrogenedentota bacterium]
MDRTACVDIQGLPLQLLLRAHPDWTVRPVVVVDRDTPLGLIQWANELAYASRIFPGMRYAAGLSLSRELRGGVVAETEITEAVRAMTQRLWCFSPRIEPAKHEHGVFWLDASGLRAVYPSLEAWAALIRDDLRDAGFRAVVAVGFSRFGSYAAAHSSMHGFVFQSSEQERAHLRQVPIERVLIDPRLRDTLLKLGVKTLGAFIALPAEGIRARFGAGAAALHELARGEGWDALNAERLFEPLERREQLDYPEDNLDRLLALFAERLQGLFMELAARHETLASLRITLRLGDGSELCEEITPATPTLDANQLLQLLRLRVGALSLSAPVIEFRMCATGITANEQQLGLFPDAALRNAEAALRAFARIRAELGNGTVVCAHLHEGHLPEARYGWEPLQRLALPHPRRVAVRPMVRRIFAPPIALPPRDRHEPDGWLIAGISEGPVEEVIGPQIVSGGWWMREIARTYFYVRTRSGRWLWIYHDQKRRRWYLQGEIL